MIVSVKMLDGRSINLPVDSASTSREICQLLANKVKLTDTFGFSIYVALYEKVRSHNCSVCTLLLVCYKYSFLHRLFS